MTDKRTVVLIDRLHHTHTRTHTVRMDAAMLTITDAAASVSRCASAIGR